MMKKELAALLGISGAMVSKLSKRGMPTDSLERAQRWRKRHLDPGRVKGTRFDGYYAPRLEAQPVKRGPVIDRVALASGLLNVASVALTAGGCIDALVPGLRAALAAVPAHERNGLSVPMNVMDLLTADVLARVHADGDPVSRDGDMSEEEADAMGRFWYQVAAGEIRPAG